MALRPEHRRRPSDERREVGRHGRQQAGGPRRHPRHRRDQKGARFVRSATPSTSRSSPRRRHRQLPGTGQEHGGIIPAAPSSSTPRPGDRTQDKLIIRKAYGGAYTSWAPSTPRRPQPRLAQRRSPSRPPGRGKHPLKQGRDQEGRRPTPRSGPSSSRTTRRSSPRPTRPPPAGTSTRSSTRASRARAGPLRRARDRAVEAREAPAAEARQHSSVELSIQALPVRRLYGSGERRRARREERVMKYLLSLWGDESQYAERTPGADPGEHEALGRVHDRDQGRGRIARRRCAPADGNRHDGPVAAQGDQIVTDGPFARRGSSRRLLPDRVHGPRRGAGWAPKIPCRAARSRCGRSSTTSRRHRPSTP